MPRSAAWTRFCTRRAAHGWRLHSAGDTPFPQSLLAVHQPVNINEACCCRYQPSVDKPGPIRALEGTSPTDGALLQITAAAKLRGLKVLWRPCVDPRPMGSSWRGQIGRAFSASVSLSGYLAEHLGFASSNGMLARRSGRRGFNSTSRSSRTMPRWLSRPRWSNSPWEWSKSSARRICGCPYRWCAAG